MSLNPLTSSPALTRLADVLAVYASYRRMTPARALDRQGKNLQVKLYEEFKAITPRSYEINQRARESDWRVGRDDPAQGGPENTGLSPTTIRLAKDMMRGHPSILARVTNTKGRDRVTPITLGQLNSRTGFMRRIRYKAGRGTVAAGRADRRFVEKGPDDRILNFRALATALEVNVREHGRRFLAVGFLYRRWRLISQANREGVAGQREFRRLEAIKSPRSRFAKLGEAVLTLGGPGEKAVDTFRLTSFVPGTENVGRTRGIFTRALDRTAEDMAGFMAQEESKRLAKILARAAVVA